MRTKGVSPILCKMFGRIAGVTDLGRGKKKIKNQKYTKMPSLGVKIIHSTYNHRFCFGVKRFKTDLVTCP